MTFYIFNTYFSTGKYTEDKNQSELLFFKILIYNNSNDIYETGSGSLLKILSEVIWSSVFFYDIIIYVWLMLFFFNSKSSIFFNLTRTCGIRLSSVGSMVTTVHIFIRFCRFYVKDLTLWVELWFWIFSCYHVAVDFNQDSLVNLTPCSFQICTDILVTSNFIFESDYIKPS